MSHDAPAGGPVVLDIGDDAGALIVWLDDDRQGDELHLRRRSTGSMTHTGIWAREAGGQVMVAAVFARLPVDRWVILDDRADGRPEIDVAAGRVCEVDLRSKSGSARFS